MSEHVLLTGGAGYVGSHTAKALAENGYRPVVLDSLVLGHAAAVKWGPLVVADIAEREAVQETIRAHRIRVLLHFAAFTAVAESVAQPLKYFLNNVAKSVALVEAAFVAGVRHVVFSSSAAIYGAPERMPIPENHPAHPLNPYGRSKLMVEEMLTACSVHGLSHVSLRYFNAAGADPEGAIGERHEPETHLIPLAIETALGRREYLDVFGTDYPTRDGTAVRDYIHVSDLAEAHLAAAKHLIDGGGSVSLNVGTGQGHTVREVVRAVESEAGQPLKLRVAGRRAGDPPALVADPAAIGRTLNWRPRHSSLEEIVRTAFRWHARSAAG